MRRTNQGRNQNSKSEDINDENMRKCSNEKERGGSVQNQFGDGNQFGLLVWDTELSRNFAVCADSGSKYGYLRPVMKCLEYSGHGVPWIAGTIFAILATHQLKLHVTLINFLAALFVDLFIVGVLKGIVRRPRPTYNKKEDMMTIATDVFSFPSGHAVRAVFVTIFFISYLGLPFYSALIMMLWSGCVCLSRILLGRHHISDVICGVLIGYLEFILLQYYWISADICDKYVVRPIQEHIHV